MIPFNAPPVVGTELEYMQAAMGSGKLCGDGGFTRRCQQWMEQHFGSAKVLLTPSCTASLEMAAILLDIQPGDEVIMPSFTFVSTANAFVLRGAKVVFVDLRPDTMNIDETKLKRRLPIKPARSCRCTTPASPARWIPSWHWRRNITCSWLKMPRRA